MSRSFSASPRPRRPLRSGGLAWLCALCLLAMQALGLWHGIAHGGAASGPATIWSQARSSAPSAALPTASDGWGHQSGDADCHVFDHLSHEQWLQGSLALDCAALAHLIPTAPIWAGAELAARWKRGARAPPSLLA